MKSLFKLSLVFAAAFLINTAHSQSKTIFIPPGLKINNGLNFASKKGKVSFFVIGENGQKKGLVARNDKGNPVPLLINSAAKVNNSTGQTSYSVCTICYEILDDDGEEIGEVCEEIDCGDLVNLPKIAVSSNPVPSIKYPLKPVSGSYKIFQGDDFELSAVYKNSTLVNYSARHISGNPVYINYFTAQYSKTEVRCKIIIVTVDSEGKTKEKILIVPCEKLPKRRGGTTS